MSDVGAGRKVLVVEDQEDNRRIVSDMLLHSGFEVIEAWDGEQGLHLAITESPDLVVMDVQLPRLDGHEATRRIKANASTRHVPVIIVTSYALRGDERKARAAGCDAYLSKPVSPMALLAKVCEFLR